ncbi:hypothetical protein ACIA8E_37505 [Streptomyces sp. NPDC051664]|uniref:hypothetical protein n=1 Tax=Streptomyces sp. NPDC051664 TaxID=3365668 RepID=UPI0037B8C480
MGAGAGAPVGGRHEAGGVRLARTVDGMAVPDVWAFQSQCAAAFASTWVVRGFSPTTVRCYASLLELQHRSVALKRGQ